MKKKVIFTLVTLLLISFLLTGCNLIMGEDDPCGKINRCAELEYTQTNLEVQTTQNGTTLVNKFSAVKGANNTMVTYSTEEMATIEKDQNGDYVVPKDMIVKKSGSATVKDGKIIEQNGDAVSIPVASLEKISIEFSKDYFTDIKTYSEGNSEVFVAKVSSPVLFTGNAKFDGQNMTVQARYNEKLEAVMIDYTSEDGASVKVIYTFR